LSKSALDLKERMETTSGGRRSVVCSSWLVVRVVKERRRRRRIGLVSDIVKWKVENVVSCVGVCVSFIWGWSVVVVVGLSVLLGSWHGWVIREWGFRKSRGRREWRNLERWRSHSVIICLKTKVNLAIHDNICCYHANIE